ncbi:hypothetical protein AZC_0848 [Azorhizobium caulinodans ORS 571]|uniref:Uncharacterized protein n=2 Tax=Azorhizobium caulinodans TaxID=7 RepID=A8HTL1_AZOC5|nr:hypothetical protein AZC_0848 [Azorhizobium caulinodans ORS 571]
MWPLVGHWIEAAARRTRAMHTPTVRASLQDRQALLWVALAGGEVIAAAVTELEVGDDGLSCRIVAAGGRDAGAWAPLIHGIEDFARAEGCVRVRFEGRTGWRRYHPDYAVKRVVFEKELA